MQSVKEQERKIHVNKWPPRVFSDVVNVNPKRTLSKGTIAKYVSMSDLKEFNKKIQAFVDREFSSGSKFINSDTVMARITPCLENGKTAFVDILKKDEVGWGSTEFIVLSPKGGMTTEQFVYYLSISPEIRESAIKAMSGTSGRQRVDTDVFSKLKINLPPIEAQRAIAKILSDLDEKIELNHRMNKTLEFIAQALFKRWFVDAENSKDQISIAYLVEFDPKIPVKKGEILPYVDMKELSTEGMTVAEVISKSFAGGSRFQNKDTLLARITPCLENGKTAFVNFLEGNEPIGFGSTEFIVMRAKKNVSPQFVYCLARDAEFRSFAIKSMVGSSGRQRVQRNMLETYEVPRPNQKSMDKFHKATLQIFAQISENRKEIKNLSQIRDALLPKLMSGKIRGTS